MAKRFMNIWWLSALAVGCAQGQDCTGWIQQFPVDNPPAGTARGAFDSLRHRTVEIATGRQTWEWDGESWAYRWTAPEGPAIAPAVVYDSWRNVTIAYGGLDNGESDADWEWNGSIWSSIDGPSPGSVTAHAMAFDSWRGVTVMFGGTACDDENCYSFSQTFEFDGVKWDERKVSGPSARFWHAMAFDSHRGVTVLYGGEAEEGKSNETWEWDGETWTLRAVGGPEARSRHSMVFDSDRGVTVMFGGLRPVEGLASGLWEWDGQTWMEANTDPKPNRRTDFGIAYDSARRAIVLFGGNDQAGPLNDTWEYVCAPPCPADLDGNLKLDLFDFLAFLNLFNAEDPAADCTADGAFDLFDFLCFTNAFNAGC